MSHAADNYSVMRRVRMRAYSQWAAVRGEEESEESKRRYAIVKEIDDRLAEGAPILTDEIAAIEKKLDATDKASYDAFVAMEQERYEKRKKARQGKQQQIETPGEASRPESAPRQEDRRQYPTQRGVRRDERTQFILDGWNNGERNRETVKRAFLLLFPPFKRQDPNAVFKQWWANAAKHCPEMWSESK